MKIKKNLRNKSKIGYRNTGVMSDKPFVSTKSDANMVYGKHPVLMAILHKRRHLKKVFLTEKTEKVFHDFIKDNKVVLPNNLQIELVSLQDLSKKLPEGTTHQGFLLECSRFPRSSLGEFIGSLNEGLGQGTGDNAEKSGKLPRVLILDEITDPHNIGAIIRSAVAFGFKNIIVPEKNFPTESGVIAKTSAGMIELVNLIEVGNINKAMMELKDFGYWIVGLASEAKDFINNVEFDNIVLVVGSEGKGIRDLVKKNCDMLVKIPMSEEVESLNASVATAVAMYVLINK